MLCFYCLLYVGPELFQSLVSILLNFFRTASFDFKHKFRHMVGCVTFQKSCLFFEIFETGFFPIDFSNTFVYF